MKVTLTAQEIIAKFGFPTDTELVIEQVQDQDDGWISNVGRNRTRHPRNRTRHTETLNPNTTLQVKFRNGTVEVGNAYSWCDQWIETDGHPRDIVAYRIL